MFSRRLSIGLFSAALAVASFSTAAFAKDKARVLVYSGSTGYRHESIPAAVASIKMLGEKAGYVIDSSEDPEVFTAENLARYKALVLVSNSTDPKKPESEWFTGSKRDALQGFLKAGKGVIGLHAAADSHYLWGWYGQMMGGYFERHPKGTPKGVVTVIDAGHPATAKLPKTLERNDEWYYYKDFDPTVRVLVTIDPRTIGDTGEADVNPNPLVWCHDFGGGRVFYSALGHTNESWSEPYMIDLMTGALAYAVGK
jgi:type 1 glutamine amidotransferase